MKRLNVLLSVAVLVYVPPIVFACDRGAVSEIQRDGRTITVRGGTSHATIDEGSAYRIRIDDHEIVVTDADVTVDGVVQPIAAYERMEVILERSGVRVTLDGQDHLLGSERAEQEDEPDEDDASSRHTARGQEGDVLRLRTVPIMDQSGFAQPVVAQTILLPTDWRVQGGVRWKLGTACPNDMVETRFLATSPDGQLAFEILPLYHWEWGEDQISQATIQMSACRLAPPLDVNGVLSQYILPNLRPGATVGSVQGSPEAARGAYEEYYSVIGPLLQMQNSTMRTDALRAVLEYQMGGRPFEEALTFSLAEIITPMMVGRITFFTANHIYAFRAPRGQLQRHDRLYATIMGSIRNNPVWQNALIQVAAAINTQASIAAGNRAAIWSNAMNQIGEMRVRTWQQNQETISRVSQSWSRTTRGVDGYFDPMTQQTVDLATGYRNAWSNGQGEYVLSVDPSYDPNVALRGNWQRMRRTER